MHGSRIEPGAAACWASYALSSRHPVAVAAYHDGIAALVAGAPFAGTLLRRALMLDRDLRLHASDWRSSPPSPVIPASPMGTRQA
jgi:hypothetical protein